jgi:hypothetical protein
MFTILIIMLLLTTLFCTFFFLVTHGKLDKRTGWFLFVYCLVGLLVGALLGVLLLKEVLALFFIFLVGLILFLIAGLFYQSNVYKLIWARKDTYNWPKDSFITEATFTLGLSSLVTALCISVFGYITKKWEVAASMWGLVVIFPFPFLLTKVFDFLQQIPRKDFDKKWFYEVFPFDETQWKRENMVSIGFKVADSLSGETKLFTTRAKFSIVIPRDQPLKLIYRLALREYHKKKPSVPVQELGYEDGIPKFWWLFKTPFLLWNPSTWFRWSYLDPNESIANNNLKNGDFIVAKRMLSE